jgi:flagellar capping protein FliD
MAKKTTLIIILILSASYIWAQQANKDQNKKVYVPLPGVSEKMNTEDIIQKLVYVKKLPIQGKESENQDIKLESDIVKDLSKYLRDLDAKSRNLYDFQSPFRDMQGSSSDPAILDTIAGRKAKKDNYKITVFQTAKPDSFRSESTPRNKILAPSDFIININDKSIKIQFTGGTISQLVNAIQQQVGDLMEVMTVNDTSSTMVLVISGKQTGEKNKINFSGDLKTLLDIQLLVNGTDKVEEHKVDFTKIVSKNETALKSTENSVEMLPGNEGEVPLTDQSIKVSEKTFFYFNASINSNLAAAGESNTASGGPAVDINLMEPVTVSNVTVKGGNLISFYEQKKEMPEMVSNFTEIMTLYFTDGAVKTYFIDNSGVFTNALLTYSGKTVEKISLRNRNTDRSIFITDARFVTKIAEGGIQPKNIISKACDALINLDGVEVRRDNNKIDDLVEGLTFDLKNESKDPVTVTVDYNYQKVEDAITGWVDSYNKAMEYLSIVTKPSQDRTRLSDRTPQNLKDGVFQAESSFLSMRNKLRNDTINAYKTIYGREMAVLEQIGLYTKKTGGFSMNSEEWSSAKMGLLNIETEKLKSALKTRYDGVEQLFANDIQGDYVKDTGVAVMINQDLKMGLGAGSFLERRIAFNDEKIKANNKDIDELNRKLGDYEMDLRVKYGKMNKAISESDSKQKWLNNQFKGGQ